MKITAIQIQDVLNRLPPAKLVESNFFSVATRPSFDDYTDIMCGAEICGKVDSFFTFIKSDSGNEWILHSMPSLEQ